MPEYIDDYSSCEETYATLRVYHKTLPPSAVSELLNLTPDRQQELGDSLKPPINGWFLSSMGKVDSLDSRHHIDYLLDHIRGKEDDFKKLLADGFNYDISNFWVSSTGNGGPTLSPRQMGTLADLGIDVHWDIYF